MAVSLRVEPMTLVKSLHSERFWLLGIGAGLIAIHLHWLWRSDDIDKLNISLILWGAVLYLLWNRHRAIDSNSGPLASLLGVLLIAGVLLRSLFLRVPNDILMEVSPVLTAVGLGLAASGFKGLKHYWREILLIGVSVVPRVVVETALSQVVSVNLIAAKFANFLLWYLSFDVSRQGVNIILPTGIVEVNSACSGLDSMLLLLRLSVLVLVMWPTRLVHKLLIPTMAVLLAFLVNGIRIVLMAILVAFSNHETFEYWHEGGGSQIFSVILMALFGWFCHSLLRQRETDNRSSAPA
jgi:cyanoexosortase A